MVSGSKDNQQPVKLWDPKAGQGISTLYDSYIAVILIYCIVLIACMDRLLNCLLPDSCAITITRGEIMVKDCCLIIVLNTVLDKFCEILFDQS